MALISSIDTIYCLCGIGACFFGPPCRWWITCPVRWVLDF